MKGLRVQWQKTGKAANRSAGLDVDVSCVIRITGVGKDLWTSSTPWPLFEHQAQETQG